MFDPERFLALASRLVQHGSGEEEYRCAVGRAYYSCYLTARNALFGIDGAKMRENESTHGSVISAISDKTIAGKLDELRELRVQADYYTNPRHRRTRAVFRKYRTSDWSDLAKRALALATEIRPALAELKPVR